MTNTNTATVNSTEKRDAPPVLLKLTPSDRKQAEQLARQHHLPLSTWVYTVFKAALDNAEQSAITQ